MEAREGEAHEQPHDDAAIAPRGRRGVVLLAAVTVLLAIVAVMVLSDGRTPTPEPASGDAVAAYEAALQADRPIYVLFHSSTCVPCVEIDAVADEVVPAYEGRISFVDALTDEPDGQRLASRFGFQFIPTSYFLSADGEIVDSHTGVLSAEQMRERLDALLEAE